MRTDTVTNKEINENLTFAECHEDGPETGLTSEFKTIEEEIKEVSSKSSWEALYEEIRVESYPGTTPGEISPPGAIQGDLEAIVSPWRPDRVRALRKMRYKEKYRKSKIRPGRPIKNVGWKAKKKAKSECSWKYWNNKGLWSRLNANWKIRGIKVEISERDFKWLVKMYSPGDWAVDAVWCWEGIASEDTLVLISGTEVLYRGGKVPEKWDRLDRLIKGRINKKRKEEEDRVRTAKRKGC